MRKVLPFLFLSAGLLITACDTTPKDTTNPTVSLAANPTSITGSGTVTLTATASDNVKVAKVQFFKGTTLLSEDSESPYQATDTLSNVTDGKVLYRAVAIDTAENKAEASAEVTTLSPPDVTAPTLTLSATPTTLSDSGNVKLVATASDDKGVIKVTFYRGDTRLGEVSQAPYEWTDAVVAGATSQSLQYRAVAADAAGNTTIKSVTVTVQPAQDKTAPTLTLSATPTTVTGSGTVKLTATASDNVGVTKVAFYRGTDLLGEVKTAPYEWSDTVSAGSVAATVNYRAIAYDAAGNKTERSVAIVLQPQVAQLAAPLPTMQVSFSKAIGYTWSDAQAVGRKVFIRSGSTVLTEGVVTGDYALTLPEVPAAKLEPLYEAFPPPPPACLNTSLTVSDPGLRIVAYNDILVESAGLPGVSGSTSYTRLLMLNPDGSVPVDLNKPYIGAGNILVYADRAATVRGAMKCSTLTITAYNVDLNLKQGWNVIQNSLVSETLTLITIKMNTVVMNSVTLAPYF